MQNNYLIFAGLISNCIGTVIIAFALSVSYNPKKDIFIIRDKRFPFWMGIMFLSLGFILQIVGLPLKQMF